MKPSPLQFGNITFPEPCQVPWNSMDVVADGNRFCQNCKKVVHDLTGKTEAEISQIREANGGQLCASFLLGNDGKPLLAQRKFKTERKPVYFRHFAAAASLFLIYQTPQAIPIAKISIPSAIISGGPTKGKTTEKENTNTMVTGVVVDQNNSLIKNELMINIFANRKEIATIRSNNGLFSVDLSTLVNPQDNVQIIVRAQNFDLGNPYKEAKCGASSLSLALKDAQNLTIKIIVTRPRIPPRRSIGIPIHEITN